MKLKTLAAIVLSTASMAAFVSAQDTPPGDPDGGPPKKQLRPEGGGEDGPGIRRDRPRLTPEQFEKLRTVREQAMENAEVKEAGDAAREAEKKFRELLHAEMLKIDPSIAEFLKMEEGRPRRGPGGPGGDRPGGPGGKPGNKPGPAGPPPAGGE